MMVSEQGTEPLILILDEITDQRKLGACLRIANAAGVDAEIMPKRNSALVRPWEFKTAPGGTEDLVLVQVTNLTRTNAWVKVDGVR